MVGLLKRLVWWCQWWANRVLRPAYVAEVWATGTVRVRRRDGRKFRRLKCHVGFSTDIAYGRRVILAVRGDMPGDAVERAAAIIGSTTAAERGWTPEIMVRLSA